MKMRTAAIAGACFLLSFTGCSGNNGDAQTSLSQRAPSALPSVILKPQPAGEEVRFVTYGPDGKMAKETRIEYVNGNTAMLYHRGDGTVRERIEHYRQDKNGNRALRATTLYDADGKTVLYDRTLYPDGITTERTATLIGKERYELNQFHKDGKTLFRRRLVERGRLSQDEEFRGDGTRSKLTEKDSNGSSVTEFAKDGATRVMTTFTPDSRYAPVRRVIYGADGLEAMRVEYSSNQIKVDYLRHDGTLEQVRTFSSYEWEVTVYDTNGKPLFLQKWRGQIKDKNWLDIEKPVLSEVEEFAPDGTVKRRITFYPDGVTPKTVKLPAPGNYASGTYRYFREDGTLEKEEVKESWDKVTSTKEYEQKDGVKEAVPPELLKSLPVRKPPVLAQMPLEPKYECGPAGCYDD